MKLRNRLFKVAHPIGDPGLVSTREIVEVVIDDGIEFDTASIEATRIREDGEYEGVRITLIARLAVARIPIQIDVGFGDAITPVPELTEVHYASQLGGTASICLPSRDCNCRKISRNGDPGYQKQPHERFLRYLVSFQAADF